MATEQLDRDVGHCPHCRQRFDPWAADGECPHCGTSWLLPSGGRRIVEWGLRLEDGRVVPWDGAGHAPTRAWPVKGEPTVVVRRTIETSPWEERDVNAS